MPKWFRRKPRLALLVVVLLALAGEGLLFYRIQKFGPPNELQLNAMEADGSGVQLASKSLWDLPGSGEVCYRIAVAGRRFGVLSRWIADSVLERIWRQVRDLCDGQRWLGPEAALQQDRLASTLVPRWIQERLYQHV